MPCSDPQQPRRLHLGLEARTFLLVGVLGGYTTFSSFSLDTFTLLKDGHAGALERRGPSRPQPAWGMGRLRAGWWLALIRTTP